jgi:hypothetical protein
MILTCPCCRASNETATCRRCRADLSLLAAVEARRAFHLVSAQRFAADGRADEALAHADRAAELRGGTDVVQLRAALLLMRGDYAGAIAAYDEMTGTTPHP